MAGALGHTVGVQAHTKCSQQEAHYFFRFFTQDRPPVFGTRHKTMSQETTVAGWHESLLPEMAVVVVLVWHRHGGSEERG